MMQMKENLVFLVLIKC